MHDEDYLPVGSDVFELLDFFSEPPLPIWCSIHLCPLNDFAAFEFHCLYKKITLSSMLQSADLYL
jgi:hypothetical protein